MAPKPLKARETQIPPTQLKQKRISNTLYDQNKRELNWVSYKYSTYNPQIQTYARLK